jgi:hypothetical protein
LARRWWGGPHRSPPPRQRSGWRYAPQLLSFLVLTPYLGSGVRVVLSIWTLLATLLAVGVTFELTRGETALVALAGWLVAEVLQRTIGRPLARLGRWVRHQVAGTELRPFEPPPGMCALVTLLDPVTLLLVALLALLLSGAFAPVEALGWWAGWYGDRADERALDPACGRPTSRRRTSPGSHRRPPTPRRRRSRARERPARLPQPPLGGLPDRHPGRRPGELRGRRPATAGAPGRLPCRAGG